MPRPVCNASTGRPIWPRVGQCGCICGGVVPCGCTSAPGCLAASTTGYHIARSIPFGPLKYLYGPTQLNCCCPPDLTADRWTFQANRASYNPRCLTFTGTASGSGGSGGFPVHQVCRELEFHNCGDALVVYREDDQFSQFPLRCTIDSLAVQTCALGGTVFSANTIGWERHTCEAHEGEYQTYVPGPNGLYMSDAGSWSLRLSTNRGPCITPGCRTCCLPDDTCLMLDPAVCLAAHGVPGTGTDCGAIQCGPGGARPRGACCLTTGSCLYTTASNCAALNGTYQGDGVLCAGVSCPPPPRRRCCLPNGSCIEATQAECIAAQGGWSPTLHCVDDPPCSQQALGACCNGSNCSQQTAQQCATNGGLFGGVGSPCTPNPCGCLGACCSDQQHGRLCVPETQAACALLNNSTWYGCGFPCEATANCTGPGPSSPIRFPTGLILPSRKIIVPGQQCADCGENAKGIVPWA